MLQSPVRFQLPYVRKQDPCEWYAGSQKHGKYDAGFKDTNYFFSPMVFETLGAINVEGEEVLRMIVSLRFQALDASLLLIVDEHGARVSCNLQRLVSQSYSHAY